MNSTYRLPHLSPRMKQVLPRLLAGEGEKGIAYALGISVNTVKVYIKAIYAACDVSSRTELSALFISQEMLESMITE
jgi:DNA-binding NarL/FixJ family response regulator